MDNPIPTILNKAKNMNDWQMLREFLSTACLWIKALWSWYVSQVTHIICFPGENTWIAQPRGLSNGSWGNEFPKDSGAGEWYPQVCGLFTLKPIAITKYVPDHNYMPCMNVVPR